MGSSAGDTAFEARPSSYAARARSSASSLACHHPRDVSKITIRLRVRCPHQSKQQSSGRPSGRSSGLSSGASSDPSSGLSSSARLVFCKRLSPPFVTAYRIAKAIRTSHVQPARAKRSRPRLTNARAHTCENRSTPVWER
eukprot:1191674-Prorocentrum_minimum.AAC.2